MEDRFGQLYRRHRAELLRLAWRVLADRGEAEDAVQESYLKLARSPVLDRGDEDVIAWLRRVCINDSFNRLRSRRRASARLEATRRMEVGRDSGEDITVTAAVLRHEVQEEVREALAALPERQRSCLLLRHSGYRYAEIAGALDLAVGSVGVLLARAERAFRIAYEELHHDALS